MLQLQVNFSMTVLIASQHCIMYVYYVGTCILCLYVLLYVYYCYVYCKYVMFVYKFILRRCR